MFVLKHRSKLRTNAPQILSFFGITQDRIENELMSRKPMYEQLQQALISARQEKKLTQTEIAERLKKPQSFVSKYESGERRLDVVEFMEVCRVIEVEPIVILSQLIQKEEE